MTKQEHIVVKLESLIERMKVNACLEDDEVKKMLFDIYLKELNESVDLIKTLGLFDFE